MTIRPWWPSGLTYDVIALNCYLVCVRSQVLILIGAWTLCPQCTFLRLLYYHLRYPRETGQEYITSMLWINSEKNRLFTLKTSVGLFLAKDPKQIKLVKVVISFFGQFFFYVGPPKEDIFS